MDKKYDVAIIGAGPGGYPAAIRLSQQGKKVALIEKDTVGGTCLNRGCIPTKALIRNVSLLNEIDRSLLFGIEAQKVSFNWEYMVQGKNSIVSNIVHSLSQLIQKNKIDIIEGTASFLSPHSLEIKETGETLETEHIIIATGSEPKPLFGLSFDQDILSSTCLLNLDALPESLVIIGGGAIGCEFATMLSSLKVKVTVIEALERILPLECEAVSKALLKSFQSKGIEVVTGSFVSSIEKEDGKIRVTMESQQVIEGEKALLAVGRHLNADAIGAEKIGLQIEKGAITTNEQMQTSLPHIYAIGDVNGKSLYAHAATHQGFIAASHILKEDTCSQSAFIPSVVFTFPEVASVGDNLKEAQKKNSCAKRVSYPIPALGIAQAARKTEGFMQIVFDEKTREILGAQVVGSDANLLIGVMSVAISNELTVDCLAETVFSHPSLPEGWHEAACLAIQKPLHFMPS